MEITINGKKETAEPDLTLRQLLEQKGINPNVVACELNLKIIRRADLANVKIQPGDQLEILQMIGGG